MAVSRNKQGHTRAKEAASPAGRVMESAEYEQRQREDERTLHARQDLADRLADAIEVYTKQQFQRRVRVARNWCDVEIRVGRCEYKVQVGNEPAEGAHRETAPFDAAALKGLLGSEEIEPLLVKPAEKRTDFDEAVLKSLVTRAILRFGVGLDVGVQLNPDPTERNHGLVVRRAGEEFHLALMRTR